MIEFPRPSDKILPHEIKFKKTPHYHERDDACNRIVGSLVGLAIGDALGACVEFRPQQYLAANPVRKMQGGGTWGLDAGKWTDDTSMALCLASSLISENGYNAYDQMVRYKWWFRNGYLSSTGNCFDIGKATRQSLMEFSTRQQSLKILYRCRSEYEVDTLTADSVERIETFHLQCGDQDSAGNGALMRLAAVPLFYFQRPTIAVDYAGRSAALTHASKKAIDACRYYAALMIGALRGLSKEELLQKKFYSTYREWFGEEELDPDIKSVAEGSFKREGGYADGIRGKGYVVNALEAALWAFWSDKDSFETGALAAVNLGDDTDTTAAIYGQLAGAYYGYNKIPKDWIEKLYAHDLIVTMGEWIHFQGKENGSTDYKIPVLDEQNQPLSVQTPTTSPIDHSKNPINTPEKSSHAKPYSRHLSTVEQSKSKPTLDRTVSLDSTTSADRIVSPRGVQPRISTTKPDRNDDFTVTTHEYPFYRNGSNLNDMDSMDTD